MQRPLKILILISLFTGHFPQDGSIVQLFRELGSFSHYLKILWGSICCVLSMGTIFHYLCCPYTWLSSIWASLVCVLEKSSLSLSLSTLQTRVYYQQDLLHLVRILVISQFSLSKPSYWCCLSLKYPPSLYMTEMPLD